MKATYTHITISPSGDKFQAHWPSPLSNQGYVGPLRYFDDPVTIILIHPTATLEQAMKSLQLQMATLLLRMEMEEAEKAQQDGKQPE